MRYPNPRERGSRSIFLRPALLILCLLFAPLAVAQEDAGVAQEDAGEAFGESVDVYVVNLDIRVTDRKGRPVSGLTAAELTLKEDGKKTEIAHFVEIPARSEGRTQAVKESLATALPSELLETPRTLVFLIDDTTVQRQHRAAALQQLRDLLNQDLLAETSTALAVYDGELRVVQQPTIDRDRLLAAIDALGSGDARGVARRQGRDGVFRNVVSRVGEIRNDVRARVMEVEEAVRGLNALLKDVQGEADRRRIENRRSFGAMGALIDGLGTLPGRKALVLVSEGLAMRPGQAQIDLIHDALTEVTTGPGGGVSGASIDSRSAQLGALTDQGTRPTNRRRKKSEPPNELFAVAALAANARVSFYPWKGHGNVGVVGADVGGEAGLGTSPGVRASREDSLVETLGVLADETGGQLAVGSGLGPLVEKALDDFGGYYSLGFSPKHGGDDQLHRLKLKVRGKGLRVWYPKSYVARPYGPPVEPPAQE